MCGVASYYEDVGVRLVDRVSSDVLREKVGVVVKMEEPLTVLSSCRSSIQDNRGKNT